jgi:uncharacterized MAPEG superfamily protein
MTPELLSLTLAALLQAVQLTLYATPANLEIGVRYTSSSRDTPLPKPLSPTTARLLRAFNNHNEGLILFTIAVLVVTLSNQSTTTTEFAAYTYLAARILYIPAYAFALNPWRSAIWFAGFLATITMLIAALIPS